MRTSPLTQSLGKHHLYREGDFIFLKWSGEFHAEEVREVIRCVDSAQKDHDAVFVLVDACAAGALGSEARKVVGAWRSPGEFACVVIFGASFATRVVVNMLSSVYGLLTGNTPARIHFMETEAEARACVETQRQDRAGQDL